MLAVRLSAYGHETGLARRPDGARLADGFEPEVALLDIGLPVMDGYELARRLAARCEPVGARLIAVSGYGQEQDRSRSADAGFAAHIVKPIDIEELETVIRAEVT